MDYKNIIFLSKDSVKAVDVDLDGNCDTVSLNGHETIPCKTLQDVKVFCDCLKDAYNIDEFSDLDIETLVIYSKVKNEMLFKVHELLKDCKQLNMIDMEKLLPVIAEKKALLPAESKAVIEFAGMYYQLSCGDDHTVQVRVTKASQENCVHLHDKDFNILYNYKNQMAAGLEEINKIKDECQYQMDALKQEFEVIEEKLNNEKKVLLDKIREYEAQLIAKKEEEKRNNFKRIVYKLDYNASYPVMVQKENGVLIGYFKFEKKTLMLRVAIEKFKTLGDRDDYLKNLAFLGLTVKKYYKDNSFVHKGDVIGIIESVWDYNTDKSFTGMKPVWFDKPNKKFFEIKAEMDGKIYWIDNHGEYLQDQDDYLILIEKYDTKADAIEWYKATKDKEAEENVGTF